MLSEDLTAKNIIFYSLSFLMIMIINIIFFLQSKWNEIGCRILFSRLFLGLAGRHCSRPPQLHLLKEKKRKSNFSSFKSSFIFRSFVLRSLQDISTSEILTHKSNRHYQFCCSYIYICRSIYISTRQSKLCGFWKGYGVKVIMSTRM